MFEAYLEVADIFVSVSLSSPPWVSVFAAIVSYNCFMFTMIN